MITWDHLRTEWQNPAFPIHGPDFSWDRLRLSELSRRKPGIVIHYGGVADAPDGDVDEPWSIFDDFLRAVDAAHRAKGYSFAYNAILDARGQLWQGRGDDFRNAANNGDYFHIKEFPETNQNLYTISVLCVVDSQDKLTDAATNRLRQFVREVRINVPGLPYRPHNFYDPTQCPGTGILGQIIRREFDSSPPIGETFVNWNPSATVVQSVDDAPPVTETRQNKYNDWAMIAFLKALQGLRKKYVDPLTSVTGLYDQTTAQFVDDILNEFRQF